MKNDDMGSHGTIYVHTTTGREKKTSKKPGLAPMQKKTNKENTKNGSRKQ